MAPVTETLYTGDGSTVLYTITFPYLETTDIYVTLDEVATTAFTLPTSTTLQFNSAPGNGVAIRIYRDTDDTALDATFSPDSSLRATDLNGNFTKLLYVVQEADDKSDRFESEIDQNATDIATNAANITTALTNAAAAVTTANSANTTSNAALAAVASAGIPTEVANVAAIPGSPSSGDSVKVIDSTGIEGFTPLANLPGGFVGDSGIYVVIAYTGATWNYVEYAANDPDDRYIGAGAIGDTQIGDNVLTPYVSSINDGQLAGLRNKIINGDFRVWQRGVGPTAAAGYLADRWTVSASSGTPTQQRDEINTLEQSLYPGTRYVLAAAAATTPSVTFEQRIEDVRTLNGQEVTISFLAANASGGSNVSVELVQNFGSGGSADVTTAVTLDRTVTATSLQRFTGTVTLGSVNGKTLGANSYLAVKITGGANNGSNFEVTEVQLEPGPERTPFERRPLGMELSLCQRYYQFITGNASKPCGIGREQGGTQVLAFVPTSVTMRAVPTVTGSLYVRGTGEQASTQTFVPSVISGTGVVGSIATAVFSAGRTVTLNPTNDLELDAEL